MNMRKLTFTIFTADNKVHSYLFNVTRVQAQEVVAEMNKNSEAKYYYMDGYLEE